MQKKKKQRILFPVQDVAEKDLSDTGRKRIDPPVENRGTIGTRGRSSQNICQMTHPMTSADEYRIKAGDLVAFARAELDPFQRAEYERLSAFYLRLAEQAERNSLTDVVYETPPPSPDQPPAQQQQQAQPAKKDLE